MKPLWKLVCKYLKKIEVGLPYDAAMEIPCVFPKNSVTYYRENNATGITEWYEHGNIKTT